MEECNCCPCLHGGPRIGLWRLFYVISTDTNRGAKVTTEILLRKPFSYQGEREGEADSFPRDHGKRKAYEQTTFGTWRGVNEVLRMYAGAHCYPECALPKLCGDPSSKAIVMHKWCALTVLRSASGVACAVRAAHR